METPGELVRLYMWAPSLRPFVLAIFNSNVVPFAYVNPNAQAVRLRLLHKIATSSHSLYGEYGMPSSHAQFMCFFAMYFTLFLWIRIHSLSFGHRDMIWRSLATFLVQCLTVVVCVSRVYLDYHTTSQVLWGALIGIFNGGCWFTIVQLLLTPFFPDIVCNPVGEFFMLRDCTLIPNILWFEYTSLKSEAKTRLRKIR